MSDDSTSIGTQKELWNQILEVPATIKNRPDVIRKAQEAWIHCDEHYIQLNGGCFKQLL